MGPPHPLPRSLGWELTMPSSTQKPSCSRTCGRRMMAVVTGGQWTMLRVTSVCDFTSCAGRGLLAWLDLRGGALLASLWRCTLLHVLLGCVLATG